MRFFKETSFISRFLYKPLNWYVGHFGFPHRGWKYFRSFLHFFDLDKRTYKKRLPGDLHINVRPNDHIQKDIFWYGHYELETINILLCLLQKDSVFIDVGANIGYYSLIVSPRLISGQVYAFEPVSFLREAMRKNLIMNHLENVNIGAVALGSGEKDSIAYISSEDNLGMSGLHPAENFSGQTENVRSISLDKWKEIEKVKKIDIVKIDVEGSEIQVLLGMQNILTADRPLLFIEIIEEQLERYGGSSKELYSLLRSYQYVPYDIAPEYTLVRIGGYKEGYSVLFLPEGYTIPKGIRVL